MVWQYRPECDCFFCSEHRLRMGGPIAKPVENVAGPEEVTTTTKVVGRWSRTYAVKPVEETLEERNERIWQAIKGVAQG